MTSIRSTRSTRAVALAALVVAIGVGMLLYLQPGQSASAHNSQQTAKSLKGAWQTNIVFTKNCPPQIPTCKEAAVQGYGRDGLVSESATVSDGSGYGQWKPNGKPRGFDYTFHELIPLPNGDYLYVIVKQTGTVSQDGKTYTSKGGGQVYTSAGTPAGPASETESVGTRITL